MLAETKTAGTRCLLQRHQVMPIAVLRMVYLAEGSSYARCCWIKRGAKLTESKAI